MTDLELTDLRNKLRAEIKSLDEAMTSMRLNIEDCASTAPNYLQSEPDAAKSETDIKDAVKILNHCAARKQLLTNAISRMDKGHFGICRSCGDEISLARLQAMPGAANCIHCQEDNEIMARAMNQGATGPTGNFLRRWSL